VGGFPIWKVRGEHHSPVHGVQAPYSYLLEQIPEQLELCHHRSFLAPRATRRLVVALHPVPFCADLTGNQHGHITDHSGFFGRALSSSFVIPQIQMAGDFNSVYTGLIINGTNL